MNVDIVHSQVVVVADDFQSVQAKFKSIRHESNIEINESMVVVDMFEHCPHGISQAKQTQSQDHKKPDNTYATTPVHNSKLNSKAIEKTQLNVRRNKPSSKATCPNLPSGTLNSKW